MKIPLSVRTWAAKAWQAYLGHQLRGVTQSLDLQVFKVRVFELHIFLLWLIYVQYLLLCNFSKVGEVLLLTAEVCADRITAGDQSTTKHFPLKEFKGRP